MTWSLDRVACYTKKKMLITLAHDRNVADFLHFLHYLLKLHYETMNTFLYLQKNITVKEKCWIMKPEWKKNMWSFFFVSLFSKDYKRLSELGVFFRHVRPLDMIVYVKNQLCSITNN